MHAILRCCPADVFCFCLLAYLRSYMSTLCLSTAEAVLQKMDDMEKMRRRHKKGLEDFGVFNKAKVNTHLFYHFYMS